MIKNTMEYTYKGKSYNRDDLIDVLKEQGKYLDRYDKIREEEETRIMQKYQHTIEDNTERILIGELLGEGVVERRDKPASKEKPVSKEKLERVRHILKEAETWELANLESEGYVDRHEALLDEYLESKQYHRDWELHTRLEANELDEYIKRYVDEEYADALIAWAEG